MKKYLSRVCDGRRIVNKQGRSRVKRWAVEYLDGIQQQTEPEIVKLDVEPESVEAGQRFVTGSV